ncbi:MAG: hypothetical protein HYY84_14145 [Deltaproteobacteria bacterium]|nr:hypothetical protein [Deltaproteobacteria bacterium]
MAPDLRWHFVIASFALFGSACGKKTTPSDVVGQGTVTPEDGGTVATSDGTLTLSFPPGAVDAAVEITVRAVAAPAVFVGSVVYRLEPSGITFATPIQLTRTVPLSGFNTAGWQPLRDDAGQVLFDGGLPDGVAFPDSGVPILLPFITSDGSVEPLIDASVSVDVDAGIATITGGVSHFSENYVTLGPFKVWVVPSHASMNVGDTQVFHQTIQNAGSYKSLEVALKGSTWDAFFSGVEPVDVASPPTFYVNQIRGYSRDGRVSVSRVYSSLSLDDMGSMPPNSSAYLRWNGTCLSAGPDELSFYVRGVWLPRPEETAPYYGSVVVVVKATVICNASLPADGGGQTIGDGDAGADAGADAGVDAGADAGDPTFCTWFPPVTIPTFGGSWCDTPTIFSAPGGLTIAIWREEVGGSGAARMAVRTDGGAWPDAGTVSSDTGAVSDCTGAALPDGRVLIVWVQRVGMNDQIFARFRLADGTMTTPVVISTQNTAPLNPSVVVTAGKVLVQTVNLNSPNAVWSCTYDTDAGTWSDAGVVGGGASPRAAASSTGEVGLLFGFYEAPNMGTRSAFFGGAGVGGWQAADTLTTSTTSGGYAGGIAWNEAAGQFVGITGIDLALSIRTRNAGAGSWSSSSGFWTPTGGGATDEIAVDYDTAGNGAALWGWCPAYKSCDVYGNTFSAGSGWKTPRLLDHSEHQSTVLPIVKSAPHWQQGKFAGVWRRGTSGTTADIRASQIGAAGTFSTPETLGANQIVAALACDSMSCTVFSTASTGCALPTWVCK